MICFFRTASTAAFAFSLSLQALANTAVEPVVRRANEPWMQRHLKLVELAQQSADCEVLFVGDSITDHWDSKGIEIWKRDFVPLHAVNLGVSGDRTQHLLWRLQNGELGAMQPKVIVMMIGTNNVGLESNKTRRNQEPEVAQGIATLVHYLREKLPATKILLLAIFPRGQPDSPERAQVTAINRLLPPLADGKNVVLLDIGEKFLGPGGTISKSVMADLLHPTPAGYAIWADAMRDPLMKLLGTGRPVAAELSSLNNEHLKKWFAKYPAADANQDGVMTSAEAWTYQGGLADRNRAAAAKAKEKAGAAAKAGPVASKRLAPDLTDVRYGPHERNVLDLWRAKSDRPTPLVIFYHGGGFRAGDKQDIADKTLREFLQAGISVAAVNYRYTSTAPLPAAYLDSGRALQFLRAKAAEWNLDPARVAAYGPSAGGGITLWLGFHDDLADAASADPIARQSTRLVALGSFAGQCTYDPHWIREHIGESAYRHTLFVWAFGVKKQEDLDNPKLQKAYDEMSPITHLGAGDPPVFQYFTEPDTPVPADAKTGQGIHHPIFGHRLKSAMDAAGIENVYRHVADLTGDPQIEMARFLQQKLLAR